MTMIQKIKHTYPKLTIKAFDQCLNEMINGQFSVAVTITPETAKHILAKHNKNNRNLNSVHVASIARDITNGNWKGHVGDELTIDENGNVINGQHRLNGAVKADIPIEAVMQFGVPAELAGVTDRGRGKTQADELYIKGDKKYATELASLTNITLAMTNNPYRPQVWINNNKASPVELTNFREENVKELKESLTFALTTPHTRDIMVTSVAALCHFVLKNTTHGKQKANEYMSGLLTGANLAADDPRFVIRSRLIMDITAKGTKSLRSQTRKDAAIGLVMKGFNSWMKNEKWTNKTRTPDEIPVIDGLKKLARVKIY